MIRFRWLNQEVIVRNGSVEAKDPELVSLLQPSQDLLIEVPPGYLPDDDIALFELLRPLGAVLLEYKSNPPIRAGIIY
jgi:hypothetical protein